MSLLADNFILWLHWMYLSLGLLFMSSSHLDFKEQVREVVER